MSDKVWFVTGASRGFGRAWTQAALERGDRVVATARDAGTLDDLSKRFGDRLLALSLDVTDRAAVFAAVQQAHRHFGRLDVILTAAGYGLFGAIEEVGEADARANMETNFYGTLSVIQAALPILREQGSGHILPVSSLGGVVALPMFFQPTKWAVEAMAEALAREVASFGIRVTLIEPGAYRTGFFSADSVRQSPEIGAYDPMRAELAAGTDSSAMGDPSATPAAIFAVLDAEAPPLRLLLGSTSRPLVEAAYASRLEEWRAWAPISDAAQGPRPGS
jgi:NAD(P)-dependent dehydrogenase (short-subunit alcohol dehydrogenase family)